MKPLVLAVLAGALALAACKKEPQPAAPSTGTITVRLAHGVSSGPAAFTPLVLDAVSYRNANGDDFTVSTFKYYLSNVVLRRADGSSHAVPDSYYLVDQAKPGSQELALGAVPAGEYTALSLVVGVDSARTQAGNFTGVLNADNGMYWDMNGPEFINLKLEGRSPQSPTTALVFHVAGYKGRANNTIRRVELPFPATPLPVRAGQGSAIFLRADVARLFTGPNPAMAGPAPFQNPVSFATVYNRMSGPAVAKLADNVAAGMFSVTRVAAD